MLFKRKIYEDIKDSYDSLKDKKTGLIIKGLREIGKTTITKEFCYNNYENVVYINFMDKPELKCAFNGNNDIDTIIRDLSALINNPRFL